MNKVILGGRITKDLELKYTTNNNTAVVTFNLAVRRNKTETDFIQIVAYGKTAELLNQYCKKGSAINVVGAIRTRNYDDKDGKKVYITEVLAEEIEFASASKQKQPKEQNIEFNENDLPF